MKSLLELDNKKSTIREGLAELTANYPDFPVYHAIDSEGNVFGPAKSEADLFELWRKECKYTAEAARKRIWTLSAGVFPEDILTLELAKQLSEARELSANDWKALKAHAKNLSEIVNYRSDMRFFAEGEELLVNLVKIP